MSARLRARAMDTLFRCGPFWERLYEAYLTRAERILLRRAMPELHIPGADGGGNATATAAKPPPPRAPLSPADVEALLLHGVAHGDVAFLPWLERTCLRQMGRVPVHVAKYRQVASTAIGARGRRDLVAVLCSVMGGHLYDAKALSAGAVTTRAGAPVLCDCLRAMRRSGERDAVGMVNEQRLSLLITRAGLANCASAARTVYEEVVCACVLRSRLWPFFARDLESMPCRVAARLLEACVNSDGAPDGECLRYAYSVICSRPDTCKYTDRGRRCHALPCGAITIACARGRVDVLQRLCYDRDAACRPTRSDLMLAASYDRPSVVRCIVNAMMVDAKTMDLGDALGTALCGAALGACMRARARTRSPVVLAGGGATGVLDYLYADHRDASFFTPDAGGGAGGAGVGGADPVSARDALLIAALLRLALENHVLDNELARARGMRALNWLSAHYNVEGAVRSLRAHVRQLDAAMVQDESGLLSQAQRQAHRVLADTLLVYDNLRRRQ